MKPRNVLKLVPVVLLVVAVGLVQVVKSIDVDHYRGLVVSWAKQQTGRDVIFSGPISLKLGLRPALVADRVSVSNRQDGARPITVNLDHVESEIGLLPLLFGEIRMSRLRIDGAALFLDSDGVGGGARDNPQASLAAGDPVQALPLSAVGFTQVVIDRLVLHLRDRADHSVIIDHATLDADGPATPMALTAAGAMDGRHLAITGILGSLKDMLDKNKPFALQIKALTPGLVASAEGTLQSDEQKITRFAVKIAAELSDSADLGPWLGLPVPSLGSARVAFTLSGPLDHPTLDNIDAIVGRHDTLAIGVKGSIVDLFAGNGADLAVRVDGDATSYFGLDSKAGANALALNGHLSASGTGTDRIWRVTDIKGGVGRSDISGEISVRRKAGPPIIDGHFLSALVDLTRRTESAAEPESKLAPDGRLLSATPLPLHLLAVDDGHLVWRIAHLVDLGLDGRDVLVDLAWQDGKFTGHAGIGAIADGSAEAVMSIDAAAKPPLVDIDLAMSGLSAGKVLQAVTQSDAIEGGRLDFRLKTTGSGDNLRAVMASQQGTSLLAVGPTRVANRIVNGGLGEFFAQMSPAAMAAKPDVAAMAAKPDVAAMAAKPDVAAMAAKPDVATSAVKTDIRCLISYFTLADGLARSEALLFALPTTVITGQGSLNLATEALDFTLTPRSTSQNAIRPLDIGGTLLHPAATPDRGAIVRTVPGVTSAAAGPLMPFVSTETSPCFAALGPGKKPHMPVGSAP